jgi:hypothetical protein
MNPRLPTVACAALLLLAACASPRPSAEAIDPVQAMLLAAEAAPATVPGTFRIHVHATEYDARKGVTYLSTERDYRDQRNLAVVISPEATLELAERHGAPPADALRGRELLVTGEARRVAIHFFDAQGLPTGAYYYQTHLPVEAAVQVAIVR